MKHLLLISLLCCGMASAKNLQEEWKKAIKGSYQDMRNVAFSLTYGKASAKEKGYAQDKESIIAGCAMRRAIVLTQQNKLDVSDYTNELMDCSKLHPADNQAAWENALVIVKNVLQNQQ